LGGGGGALARRINWFEAKKKKKREKVSWLKGRVPGGNEGRKGNT